MPIVIAFNQPLKLSLGIYVYYIYIYIYDFYTLLSLILHRSIINLRLIMKITKIISRLSDFTFPNSFNYIVHLVWNYADLECTGIFKFQTDG